MVISRIKQVYMYFFVNYKDNNDLNEILSKEELKIFNNMSNYDKVHSYRLLKLVQKNDILKDNQLYFKLALLHDCGKGNQSFLSRVLVVLKGNYDLNNHPLKGYEKLKDINLELAKLCKMHHDKTSDINMLEFQKLDDM